MKKNRKRQRVKKNKGVATATPMDSVTGRRNVLRWFATGGLGVAATGGVGWWVVSGVRAVAAEQDLTRVGSGLPTIVQIHDPQCAMCTELQRATRKALRCFDDDELLYLVANIRTQEGANFAAARGLPHVTLVLLDGRGEAQSVLQGVRQRDELKSHFEVLVARA